MSMLSPRLQLKVAQKQILTPSLVQMVTLLQLNKLELREMISQELSENPILEEGLATEEDELTSQEIQGLLEKERVANPADQSLLDALHGGGEAGEAEESTRTAAGSDATDARAAGGRGGITERRGPFRRDRFRRIFQRLPRPRLSDFRSRTIRRSHV